LAHLPHTGVAAGPVSNLFGGGGMTVAHKLILNKDGEEQVHEFGDIEEAFNAAVPWIMKGYIARITDKHGVVKYTQALTNGQIATYPGDTTAQTTGSGPPTSSQAPTPGPKKPWWRFW
jgi:hypothetical protein